MNKYIKPALSVALAVAMGFGSVQAFAGNSIYFADVNDDNYGWAAESVDLIASKGIATGVGNNMYAPQSLIKRGDFAILLDKTFQFTQYPDTLFNMIDVTPDKYYYQSIVNGKFSGAIKDEHYYRPDAYITRLEAIKMIYNAFEVQKLISSKTSSAVGMYSDYAEIKNIADQIAVGTLTNMGIIVGSDDGMLHPNDNLTRAEMAVIFAKTSNSADEAKANLKAEEENKKQQEIEDSMAKEDKDESSDTTLVASGNVNKPMVIDSGKNYEAHDITLGIDAQDSDAMTITNGSNVKLKKSSIKTTDYAGIKMSDKSTLNLDNVSVVANNASAIISDGESTISAKDLTVSSDAITSLILGPSKADFDNLKVNTNDAAALSLSAGAEVNIDQADLSIDSNKSYSLIDIVSKPEDSTKQTQLNIKDGTFNNHSGSLFNIRESKVNIELDNCTADISSVLNLVNDRKNAQEEGNEIYITLKNSQIVGDIKVDNKTKLTLDLQYGSSFKGFIDPDMNSEDINIKLSGDCQLELLGDTYVNYMGIEDFNFNNINDNGFNIFYNDANSENDELYADTYTLAYGGQLLPR